MEISLTNGDQPRQALKENTPPQEQGMYLERTVLSMLAPGGIDQGPRYLTLVLDYLFKWHYKLP